MSNNIIMRIFAGPLAWFYSQRAIEMTPDFLRAWDQLAYPSAICSFPETKWLCRTAPNQVTTSHKELGTPQASHRLYRISTLAYLLHHFRTQLDYCRTIIFLRHPVI